MDDSNVSGFEDATPRRAWWKSGWLLWPLAILLVVAIYVATDLPPFTGAKDWLANKFRSEPPGNGRYQVVTRNDNVPPARQNPPNPALAVTPPAQQQEVCQPVQVNCCCPEAKPKPKPATKPAQKPKPKPASKPAPKPKPATKPPAKPVEDYRPPQVAEVPVPAPQVPPAVVVPPPVATPVPRVRFTTPECPNGYAVVANAWSLQRLPRLLQIKAEAEMAKAANRDTQGATRLEMYTTDAVSRTLGRQLRVEVKRRFPEAADLPVRYVDKHPQTKAVTTRDVGVLRMNGGMGTFWFSEDPRSQIVETVWPASFISPEVSGGERRLRLFPDEWSSCVMNLHGLVP